MTENSQPRFVYLSRFCNEIVQSPCGQVAMGCWLEAHFVSASTWTLLF